MTTKPWEISDETTQKKEHGADSGALVGLDREAAKDALASFMEGQTLSANQIEFVNLVIDHLTERGVMDLRRLYESPFTDIDDQGVTGVFSMTDAKILVRLLEDVHKKAAA